MLRYANGARGVLLASQVAPGNENSLRLRVYLATGAGWNGRRKTRTGCGSQRPARSGC